MLDQSHRRFESGPFVGLPRGHYRVALIDPPSRFQAWSHRGEGKSPFRYYCCQSLEEISTLPVDQLMAADSVVFLWVVQTMLPEALHVLEAWDFKFKTVAFVWNKMPKRWSEDQLPLRIRPRKSLGHHTRSGSEQCWLAARGLGYERQSRNVGKLCLLLFANIPANPTKSHIASNF